MHRAAFGVAEGGADPMEVGLLDALRDSPDWIPALSWVAEIDGEIVGHVVCTRGRVGDVAAVGLGPLGVLPGHQGSGVGSALMYAVIGAADALGEPFVALLGSPDFYGRFGFEPAARRSVAAPEPAWGDHFQVRTLTAHDPTVSGTFVYAAPFGVG